MIKLNKKNIFLGIYGWEAYLALLKMMQLVYKHTDEMSKMLNCCLQDPFWWALERTDEIIHKERNILSLPIRLNESGELFITKWPSDEMNTVDEIKNELTVRLNEAIKEAETDEDRRTMQNLKKSFNDEYQEWNTPLDPFRQECLMLLMKKYVEDPDDRTTIEEIQKIIGKQE